ncbi:MAG: hypothetical protein JWM11_4409 [Planctomycetaceae bacterium]|nr:hypothetical protein [Planctomycetaceae bacterium]
MIHFGRSVLGLCLASVFISVSGLKAETAGFSCPLAARPSLRTLTHIAGTGSIPIVLVHGWTAERPGGSDPSCVGWTPFLDGLLTPEIESRFSFYIFVHDSSEPVGFDGSGNAQQLGEAIDLLNLAPGVQIGVIAHSRGGLVARAFMNRYKGGAWGDRTFTLITLATPHHGSPAATPDWGLKTINDWNIPKKDCVINFVYNTNSTDNKTAICKSAFKTLRGTPFFNVNDVGALDLGWDNFQSEYGIPYSGITITKDVAVGKNHIVSQLDANQSDAQLALGQTDTDLHPQSRDHGSLASLNAAERFANKIIAYAGYFIDPTDRSLTLENVVEASTDSDLALHMGLRYTAGILADFKTASGSNAFFVASDGIVPLQSALFLGDAAGTTPPYDLVTDQWCPAGQECHPYLRLSKDLTMLSRAKAIRPFGNLDHLQVKSGGSDLEVQVLYFQRLRQDLTVAADSMTVTDPNGVTPHAGDDAYSVVQGGVLTVGGPGVLANDTMPSGVVPEVEFYGGLGTGNPPPGGIGSFQNLNNGGFIWDLSSSPSVTGHFVLSYVIHSEFGDSNVASIVVSVEPRAVTNQWLRSGLDDVLVEAVAIDPKNPRIVYAGTNSKGVFKSIDSGTTWHPASDGISDAGIFSLTIDPSDSAVVYATYGCFGSAFCGGIYKTIDGGANWRPVNNGLPHSLMWSLTIDPDNPQVLYAGSDSTWVPGTVSKSIDGGATWTSAVSPVPTVFALAVVDRGGGSVVYAGTFPYAGTDPCGVCDAGLLKSEDGGVTWQLMTAGNVLALAVDRNSPGTLYVGTSLGGVLKTVDGGITFQSHVLGSVRALVVDPRDSTVLYAAAGAAVWKSSDSGLTWATLGTGLPGGIAGTVRSLAIDPVTSAVYVGTDSPGIFKLY